MNIIFLRKLYNKVPFQIRTSIFRLRNNSFIKVYSHPRSGTHFLEAFLAKNFYPKEDLSVSEFQWGHWSNREKNKLKNPYGKLFGSHDFPDQKILNSYEPMIYIMRDPRSVAVSIFKTENFLSKEMAALKFSEFLKKPIDWVGSPANKSIAKHTIIEHCILHHNAWYLASKKNSNILVIKYEELKNHPEDVYETIYSEYFNSFLKKHRNQVEKITKPIGLLPNAGEINTWQDYFDSNDLKYYESLIKSDLNYPLN